MMRSRFSSQNYGIKTSFKQLSSLNETYLVSKETNLMIKKLINLGQLHVASKNRIISFEEQLISQDNLTFCCVQPSSISMPHSAWEFTFDLYIPYKVKKVYVYKTFKASYDQLKRIDNRIITQMHAGYKYFPLQNEKYPSVNKYPSIQRKRGNKLIQEMKKEEKFIVKPNLPSRKKMFIFGSRSATFKDLDDISTYLNRLFSSPSLMKTDFVFDELKFPQQIKELLRSLASNKLNAWMYCATKTGINYKDPEKLISFNIGDEYEFHTIYITRRPLNDSTLNIFNFNHWAIKAEGNTHLMTTEFFSGPKKDHGIIKTKILLNTPINRRVFWYYWPKDDITDKPQYLTDRWANIQTIYVSKLHIGLIGKLICTWLKTNNNREYRLTTNNCQHFVRDLCTVLDMKIAKRLNGLMEHRLVASAIPAAALADGMSEEARTNDAYTKLKQTIFQHKMETAEPEQKRSYSDEIRANLQEIADSEWADEHIISNGIECIDNINGNLLQSLPSYSRNRLNESIGNDMINTSISNMSKHD